MPLGYEHGQRSSTLQPPVLEEPQNSFGSIALFLSNVQPLLPEDAALDFPRKSPRRVFRGAASLRVVGHRLPTEMVWIVDIEVYIMCEIDYSYASQFVGYSSIVGYLGNFSFSGLPVFGVTVLLCYYRYVNYYCAA